MNKVTVSKDELLVRLRENREQHREIFLEAQEGYRQQVIAELEKHLAEAREGKRIRRHVELPEPVDQTKEYDRAIAMLEMSVDDEVELSEMDFACFVLDDWRWKDQFLSTNVRYSSTARQRYSE